MVLLYSTAIPSVMIFGFLFVVSHYWLDKYYMLRTCKLPAVFACTLNDRAINLFAFAVVLHILSAMWICSTPALFPTRVLVYQSFEFTNYFYVEKLSVVERLLNPRIYALLLALIVSFGVFFLLEPLSLQATKACCF